MPLSEFELIERLFTRRGGGRPDVRQGIGDDGAVLVPPPDQDLVAAVDTLVAGVHFPLQTESSDIGHKALAVNLSDLAAMGALPAWYTLALTVPEADPAWLEGFAAGLSALAGRYGMELVGGDTTRGPLSVTVQAHGFVPRGQALYRRGAQAGDLIYVTGELGGAGLALRSLQGGITLSPQVHDDVMQRLNRPEPRFEEGRVLLNIANAAIDISDGLVSDLGRMLKAGAAGATVQTERVPVSAPVRALLPPAGDQDPGLALALTAGDDYELCFTVAEGRRAQLDEAMDRLGRPCTCIGVVEAAPGLRWRMGDGGQYTPPKGGYDHFAGQGG
ncbi:MAG TPA: thiamine-phosphate kinase [Gammaproteobacteria bacterium]|nr:thiamine-phosphate kinase [Gammaproteobacteria bacterium]